MKDLSACTFHQLLRHLFQTLITVFAWCKLDHLLELLMKIGKVIKPACETNAGYILITLPEKFAGITYSNFSEILKVALAGPRFEVSAK